MALIQLAKGIVAKMGWYKLRLAAWIQVYRGPGYILLRLHSYCYLDVQDSTWMPIVYYLGLNQVPGSQPNDSIFWVLSWWRSAVICVARLIQKHCTCRLQWTGCCMSLRGTLCTTSKAQFLQQISVRRRMRTMFSWLTHQKPHVTLHPQNIPSYLDLAAAFPSVKGSNIMFA